MFAAAILQQSFFIPQIYVAPENQIPMRRMYSIIQQAKQAHPTNLQFWTFSLQKSKLITFLFLAVGTLLPSTLTLSLIQWQHRQDFHFHRQEYRQTGIVWISSMCETCGFFVNRTVTGASLPPLKTKKRACHSAKMAYTGCVLSSLLC